ncbi:hypothetical protein M0811_08440 [Anaeramoeba ignava]|uniref:E2 ubiquitin-conjugating enzyme n=1 Tax=Anaeramoeba ignava TaxID=1746090 RepID=A0A9Q0RB54_ANAIG|nr:hypothetical protein M0811_08865 [Anaeramoeba ignava]KAJ5073603.1 hypothetical protein M0811_08440 [Anaeramoeba ignava]|eukprot:Anaeramoba_ignava/a482347_319.p1 GENE.a482347_319~~a482347_319.p1  ORF type:complete len:169 (+),score=58.33 a482347_319:61-567(+)
MTSDKQFASNHLLKQFRELSKNPVDGFSAGLIDDDPFNWEITVIGPTDTLYEGGIFRATLAFPDNYPNYPPKMKFISEMWHPNIYKDGTVCISILHQPGKDEWGYEDESERWLPVHSVESILISVISMLSSPNDQSPANIDAAVEWRQNPKIFKRKVYRTVARSQEML